MFDLTLNEESLSVSELHDKSKILEATCKLRAARRYNMKVRPRSFQTGDLVLRMRSDARKDEGKFSSNIERPFRIRQEKMRTSSHPTWKDPSESEKLQLEGIPLRVVIGQNCLEDVECHATQILL